MTSQQAQSAVSLSAFVVAAVYGYRKIVEQKTSSPTTHFVIGFGVVYITLSLVAQGAPALGGMLAVLVATGDLLANGTALTKDLTGALNQTATATTPTKPSTAPAISGSGTAPGGATITN